MQIIIDTILKAYPKLERIYLYGSYARDEQTDESDIDVQVMMPQGSFVRRYDLALNSKLTELTGKEVHIVFATRANQWCEKLIYPNA